MSDTVASPAAPIVAGPKGIGGWLILPMLGLFATVGLQLYGLTTAGETFASLSALNGLQSNMVVAEFILNLIIFLGVPIALLVLLFSTRRSFPRMYIWWQVIGAAFVVIDLLAGYALFHDAYEASGTPFFDSQTIRSLTSTIIGICIWVPYMLQSMRVKNTFVN
jgi:hypothetical protein